MDKGEEGPEAFGRRVIGDLYDRGPIMVLNDEAHHAYRPAPIPEGERVVGEAKEERRKPRSGSRVSIGSMRAPE